MDAKLLLLLPLGLPVFAVVVWFFFRLFNGRWADEADPRFAEPQAGSGAPPLTVMLGGRSGEAPGGSSKEDAEKHEAP